MAKKSTKQLETTPNPVAAGDSAAAPQHDITFETYRTGCAAVALDLLINLDGLPPEIIIDSMCVAMMLVSDRVNINPNALKAHLLKRINDASSGATANMLNVDPDKVQHLRAVQHELADRLRGEPSVSTGFNETGDGRRQIGFCAPADKHTH